MSAKRNRHWAIVGALSAVLVLFASITSAAETVVVQAGTPITYVANTEFPGLDDRWTLPGFDDSSWSAGTLGIGYEFGAFPPTAESLLATTVVQGARSIYVRAPFEIVDVSQVTDLVIGADYDDGWAAWINGVEVYRSPELPVGALSWNAVTAEHESSNGTVPNYLPLHDIEAKGLPALVDGTNVLAVAVWNISSSSSDLVLVPQLTLNQPVSLLRGPYLQSGSPESVTVCWRTDITTSSTVRYGTSPDTLDQTALVPGDRSEHTVELTGLQPDTRYYYSCGLGPDTFSTGADHTFVTAPPVATPKPFRAWILGDSGTGDAKSMAVRDAYRAFNGERETDLWLMLGDNAYPDGTEEDYQRALFDIYPDMLRRSVLWPTLGNHDAISADSDTQTGAYYDIFTLPTAGESGGLASGTEAYYSFDYANVHFVVLDSHETPRGIGSAMIEWLEQDLAANLQDWTVAFWHHPPYSKGSHDSDLELRLIEMRENAVPILEDHGVDLMLSGHSHSYERSFLIDGHYGDSTTLSPAMIIDGGSGQEPGYLKHDLGPVPHQGTVYTVAGSSGQITGGPLDHPAMYVSFNTLGSLVLDVSGNRLQLRFLDSTGEVLDDFVMRKGLRTPVTDFTGSPLSGAAPLTVAFSDLTANEPTAWDWDFENDGIADSVEQSPVNEYADPGIYSVRLDTSNVIGSSSKTHENIICVHRGQPTPVTGLHVGPLKGDLTWNGQADANSYDVMRGNLNLLRDSDGRFDLSALTCVGDNVKQAWTIDESMPGPGQALMYLVRATDCAPVTGTFDSAGPNQSEPRDPESQGLGFGCTCEPGDDLDHDGYCTAYDNCISVGNPTQSDLDGDGFGDACDSCTDSDGDGVGDPGFPISFCGVDNCPSLPNDQADRDLDGRGDACDICPDDPEDDADFDGLCANEDNCPDVANLGQADDDGDGVGDPCDPCADDTINDPDADGLCPKDDNCPFAANADQADLDGDGPGDACDECTDTDGDGFANRGFLASTCGVDNCPELANPGQENFDGDLLGDVCDLCTDSDDDGFGNLGFPLNTCTPDNCAFEANPDQRDMDADAVGDACDDCPRDPDNDIDEDGSCEDEDNCPYDFNPDQNNTDGDNHGDACDTCTDTDGDGFGDPGFTANFCETDNCPAVPNDQSDLDSDGRGDICDVCPTDSADDVDFDGVCGSSDNCPTVVNPEQADFDADGLGDRCDPCTDPDNDGFGLPGFPAAICPLDNCPFVRNPGQEDQDGDGDGDNCDLCRKDADNDIDDDGVCGDVDNCPVDANADQADPDADGAGTACDACPDDRFDDSDGDGVCNPDDNCPSLPNPDQLDSDGNGVGDTCALVPVAGGFLISSTEVTNAEYVTFLNAVALNDTNWLYNNKMSADARGGIDRNHVDGGFAYAAKPGRADKPVNFVSWLDAARYVNWLQNGRPTGEQDETTTETGTYDLTGVEAGSTAVRGANADYFLPTAAEWDLAAYDDPSVGRAWTYPTRSDATPIPATADEFGDVSNAGPNVVNYDRGAEWNGQNGNVTAVGSAGSSSASAWGTLDQAGNVAEWVETRVALSRRQVRGGSYRDPADALTRLFAVANRFDHEEPSLGFRIAARIASAGKSATPAAVPSTRPDRASSAPGRGSAR